VTGIAIVGSAVTRFGKYLDDSLEVLGGRAIAGALADADIEASDIDMVFAANSMAAVTTGQVSVVGQCVLRANGFSGVPVFNIDNACASSSSALALAVHAIRAGAADTALVFGAEKLYARDRATTYRALNGAADMAFVAASGIDADRESVFVAAVYPARLAKYSARWGLKGQTLASISVKNRRHAGLNPDAQYRDPLTVEQVLESRIVAAPVTALMCAPIGDGASAAVLTRSDKTDLRGRRPVWVRGVAVGMGGRTSDGRSVVARVSERAFREAGLAPSDVDVAEVHDSIAFNELLAYEELGFCAPGGASRLIEDGVTCLGGALPVNTSGGLESRGHPVAATGLAQIAELVKQLRGSAGDRQVVGARTAVAENAGGFTLDDTAAVAVTVLSAEKGES
jgi:acetyl-CoA acyltransferase